MDQQDQQQAPTNEVPPELFIAADELDFHICAMKSDPDRKYAFNQAVLRALICLSVMVLWLMKNKVREIRKRLEEDK